MLNFINRVLSPFSLRAVPTQPVQHTAAQSEEQPGVQEIARLVVQLREMERRLEYQRRHLDTSRSMLQQVARLARFHQPSLERQITALLAELETHGGAAFAGERAVVEPRGARLLGKADRVSA